MIRQLDQLLTKQPQIIRDNMEQPEVKRTVLLNDSPLQKPNVTVRHKNGIILEIIKEFNMASGFSDTVDVLLNNAIKIINGSKAIALFIKKNGEIGIYRAVDAFGNHLDVNSIKTDDELISEVLDTKATCYNEYNHKNIQYRQDCNIISRDTDYTFCSPLLNGGKIFGFIYTETHCTNRFLLDEMKAYYEIITVQGAIALNKAQLKEANHRTTAELKRIQDDARAKITEAERLKDEFLSHISHEIRTPLNIIINYNDLIKDELKDYISKDAEVFFDAIDIDSRRLIRTIDHILIYAQLKNGKFKIKMEKFDVLTQALNPVISEFKKDIRDKNLRLKVIDRSKNPFVFADLYSIENIFRNLIENAIKFTERGEITIQVENIDSTISIAIQDTGRGMSKEYLKEICTPFSQEEQGFTKTNDGSGLGLTLVKKFLDLNGGSLTIDSEPGVGSIFRVNFDNIN